MPEPLKNLYSKKFLTSLANELNKNYPKLDPDIFFKDVVADGWRDKELKERMRHISLTLYQHLPRNFNQAIEVMKATIDRNFEGFEYMFFPDYVELFGLDSYDESISALEFFTEFASAEFAVRPFIQKYPKQMMAQMKAWTGSDNHHVRRLASEGCRPRLPWAMALPEFKKNPQPVLNILEKLKSDESEYVRRSVANNINDISKDHPELVSKLAKKWHGKNDRTNWVVKHGCRTLLKSGDVTTMRLFGFGPSGHIEIKKLVAERNAKIGSKLGFSFLLKTSKKQLGKLRIEYAIDFVRLNNKSNRKVFKISEGIYPEQERSVKKNHSFKLITTRKYYPGLHKLTLIINGKEMGSSKFQLKA